MPSAPGPAALRRASADASRPAAAGPARQPVPPQLAAAADSLSLLPLDLAERFAAPPARRGVAPPATLRHVPTPPSQQLPDPAAPGRRAPTRPQPGADGTQLTPPPQQPRPDAEAPALPLAPGGRAAPGDFADMLVNACMYGAAFAFCGQLCGRLWGRFDRRRAAPAGNTNVI